MSKPSRFALILGLAGAMTGLSSLTALQKDPDATGVAEAIRFEKAKKAAPARQAPPRGAPDRGQTGGKRAGTYQRLRILGSESAAESRFDGKVVINLASNNYLGLTTHPKLREAALEATRRYGVRSGGVRMLSGTMSLHMQLEERIARFKNVEACVVFQSGFAANAGTVAAVLTPEDHIVSDELNHASIIDCCRLFTAKIHVF